MRFEGKLKIWNEAKGFGFLTPAEGGQDIFLHASVLPRGIGQPSIGQVFTFEVELNREGKKRATRVQLAQPPLASTPSDTAPRARPVRAGVAPRRRQSRVATVLVLLLIGIVGIGYWQRTERLQRSFESTAAENVPAMAAPATKPNTVVNTFRCDGRTHCSQMTSCTEAKFFLAQCPGVKMDGNNDGIPCEQQWCTSPFAQ